MSLAPMVDPTSEGAFEPIIFIVNRDDATRGWIEDTLMSAGLRAQSFRTGAELLQHVQDSTIACAILDLSLPDASGLELQNDLARSGVPALFLTQERCIVSCVRAVKAGAVDFLTMPCDAMTLVRALRCAITEAKTTSGQRVQLDELRSKYGLLTPRERQVFVLVASGLPNKKVAYQLNISEITVQIHRGQVMRKMAARSFASLVRMSDSLQLSRPQAQPH
jgi:FixJ family two-component response regulator